MTVATGAVVAVGIWYGLHVYYDLPVFLMAPPAELFWARFKACFGLMKSTSDVPELKNYKMPKVSSQLLFVRLIIYCINLPLYDLFMLIDEIKWGKEYRKVSLDDSVFLVGGFRTGSTSL